MINSQDNQNDFRYVVVKDWGYSEFTQAIELLTEAQSVADVLMSRLIKKRRGLDSAAAEDVHRELHVLIGRLQRHVQSDT
jgi:hypothetical protein